MTTNIAPSTSNLMYQNKFQFTIKNFPNTSFFCNEANIPGVSINVIDVGNPLNKISVGGNKVTFEELNLTFRVDENLKNYTELWNWIIGIGAPNSFDQFKKVIQNTTMENAKQLYQIKSDATLFTLKNTDSYNMEVVFKDLFPTSLTSLSLSHETNSPMVATCTFRYMEYEFRAT